MEFPFIYGAQYYRAPTPHSDKWENDLKLMHQIGFTDVKFWAQWRWACRTSDNYYFDDLDTLMDLAYKYKLRVTINVICDVCPNYIYEKYPNCRPVDINNNVYMERGVSCRQIGGYPGPCYNHTEAFKERMKFINVLVNRYKNHPAMFMWDMWNEPEHNLKKREAKLDNLFCYCHNCKEKFILWLKAKYKSIEKLNEIWGRCYNNFAEIELPRNIECVGDFLDYRLFALDTMAKEAKERVLLAKSIDKNHAVYLHPVPNTGDCFNSLTGVDDFKMSKYCDCFAGTTNGIPCQPLQTTSSAKGKVAYNVESHLRYGSIAMFPKTLQEEDFLNIFYPQIGLGIKGFLHWQFDAETLGIESPAWGLNGNETSLKGASDCGKTLKELFNNGLLNAYPKEAEIGIYKSSTNDIVHFCMNENIDDLINSINSWTKSLYALNGRIEYINDEEILNVISKNIKVLIMPYVFALNSSIMNKIKEFVEKGGILITEPHLGAYDIDTNRIYNRNLCEIFGIKEINSTSLIHLDQSSINVHNDLGNDDVSKAIKSFGNIGSDRFIVNGLGINLIGYKRYAEYEGENLEVLGTWNKRPIIVKKNFGKGSVICLGSLFGENEKATYWQNATNNIYEKNPNGDFKTFIYKILKDYISLDYENCGIRKDILFGENKDFMILTNLTDKEIEYIFENNKITLKPHKSEIKVL